MFSIGYIPDVYDPRDHDYKDVLAKASISLTSSDEHSLEQYVVEVLNQLNLGSCVANAGYQGVRVSQVEQLMKAGQYDPSNPPPLGARLFGYYNARSYHNATDQDSGTYIRYFFKALNKFGFCSEDKYVYDTSKFSKRPGHAAYKAGYDQKDPTDYYRITGTGEDRLKEIRTAIANDDPVVFGTAVSEDFCRGIGINDIIDVPTGTIAGGHAMMVEGFKKNYFVILNSWDDSFGDNGRVKFSEDYMAWSKTQDLWVVRKAPQYSK